MLQSNQARRLHHTYCKTGGEFGSILLDRDGIQSDSQPAHPPHQKLCRVLSPGNASKATQVGLPQYLGSRCMRTTTCNVSLLGTLVFGNNMEHELHLWADAQKPSQLADAETAASNSW